MSFCRQFFSVPSNAGGLRFVRTHFPSCVRGGGAGGHQTQRWVRAEQGAAVDDVECDGQPAYRHNHTGGQRSSGTDNVAINGYILKKKISWWRNA